MPTYTVTLTDAEDKALRVVAMDPQEWIDNVVHERCRIAMGDIVQAEVKAIIDEGRPISGPLVADDLVLSDNVKTAVEREDARQEAEALEKTSGADTIAPITKGA